MPRHKGLIAVSRSAGFVRKASHAEALLGRVSLWEVQVGGTDLCPTPEEGYEFSSFQLQKKRVYWKNRGLAVLSPCTCEVICSKLLRSQSHTCGLHQDLISPLNGMTRGYLVLFPSAQEVQSPEESLQYLPKMSLNS